MSAGFDPVVKDGTAYAVFAYDVGLSIGLDAAEKGMTSMTERAPIRHEGRAPKHFEFEPSPLRVVQSTLPHQLDAWRSLPSVETVLYDFGAVTVTYQIPLSGPFSSLVGLSGLLYDNETLLADSRRLVEELLAGVRPAVARPRISAFYEDYVIYQLREFAEPDSRRRLLAERPELAAQVLRADPDLRSKQEVEDALACQVSYADDDLALVDWVSAILFDRDADDTRAVLEFAAVQLLELRHLDSQLDDALDRYYNALSRRRRRGLGLFSRGGEHLREIGELHVEGAVLFEGINNALKLIGDQYLARLYQQAARRYHLGAWDASIQRKLKTLDSIYDKMENALSTARLEFLEWIVILLIALELVVPFLAGR
ncbi:MAG: hypothetical protein HY552_00630 [Elusimicrobia bacterium]|nr:hypothetical protein [Elusimicrobiota bacterium]